MSEPLVSVVMPTFNHSQYIKEAIDSVLSQTYENIELIIVDNFSTDNTKEIIEKYDNGKIKYVQFANNGIIAASRNQGIKRAEGKYIAFIDSDDIWFKDKIELQVKLFDENNNLGLVYSKFKILSNDDDNGRTVGPKHNIEQGNVYSLLIKSNFITSSSSVVRSDVLNILNGFDESTELRCSEDFDLWLRVAKDYPIGYVNKPLGQYRKHPQNESAGSDRLQKALNVINKHLVSGWVEEKEANRAMANFTMHQAWVNMCEEPKQSRAQLLECIKVNPGCFKILVICLAAVMFSFFPGVHRYLREKNFDKKMIGLFKNSQDL